MTERVGRIVEATIIATCQQVVASTLPKVKSMVTKPLRFQEELAELKNRVEALEQKSRR